jgi:glycosyltransferase involved in cell wall biosynthesis
MIKVSHLSYSDNNGGAARAAYRIHRSLLQQRVDSILMANAVILDDWTVQSPSSKWAKLNARTRPHVGVLATRLLKTSNQVIHSPALLPSGWPARIDSLNPDIVNLHWVNSEMLSISDIGKLRKPVVWTLHDMWAFCGSEHYTEEFRWKNGYYKNNRPTHESGLDLNRWAWTRKRKYWPKPMHIIAPSYWIADCARQSALMKEWPITVVPNAIDTDLWRPIDKSFARELLGLPLDVPLLLFGAIGGKSDPRKGFDLLQDALKFLSSDLTGMELVIFGQLAPKIGLDLGFPIHYVGHLQDEISLMILYNAADALVIPSRQDNLPNTGLEAHACGTPVVAFDTGGLSDIVSDRHTGFLAKAFDVTDLARGIAWVLKNSSRLTRLRSAARSRAVERWSYEVISKKYIQVYRRAMNLSADV